MKKHRRKTLKIEDTRGWEKSSDPYMRKAAYYADIARKLQAHIAEFERQSRERCRHDANRIKELQAELAQLEEDYRLLKALYKQEAHS